MNRIICDICGSAYPETDERCPVCNYPRQGNEKQMAEASAELVQTKVKGGRFSSKNVKKRQKELEKAAQSQDEANPNKPLLLVIAVLLIAIALVSLYIGLRFFRGRDAFPGGGQMQSAASTTVPTETTVPPTTPCTGIVLDAAVVELEALGEQKQLVVTPIPQNTTDTVVFESVDPAVATVSETGLITAVGSGQTTVTITCGSQVKTCTVVCWYQEETTAPTESKPILPGELELNKNDVSCYNKNETFTLTAKVGGVSVGGSDVTWTSSDPGIASVEDGVVTALGKGTATITADYHGEIASCTVRCHLEDDDWKASASDVTLSVGESFQLTVTNGSGVIAEAIWEMSTDGIVSISGTTVTGRTGGTVTLTATVEDVTLTCIVRVQET